MEKEKDVKFVRKSDGAVKHLPASYANQLATEDFYPESAAHKHTPARNGGDPVDVAVTTSDLTKLTKAELLSVAESRGVTGVSEEMIKSEIIAAIEGHQA